ncbi:hypothetical protein [Tatumella citrea]|uniref:Uncharacterized protein n=1 Tax=Tatumella citrea TaxID=53336 RepID=A0A1Y0LHR9_TATCI|nr:hypothetical protein [Tatumella citrea]ARU93618.1 hypothetical protein A7K98_07420 [Tatumella citrea]ARU97656.1 hypothetical protein A7K99_07420 [Tatumella citrea]
MNNSKPEEAMTFGELLTLIHQQQQRLQVLESSFSQLITLLSPGLQQQLVSYLSVQAGVLENEPDLQKQYADLASDIQNRTLPDSTVSPDIPG